MAELATAWCLGNLNNRSIAWRAHDILSIPRRRRAFWMHGLVSKYNGEPGKPQRDWNKAGKEEQRLDLCNPAGHSTCPAYPAQKEHKPSSGGHLECSHSATCMVVHKQHHWLLLQDGTCWVSWRDHMVQLYRAERIMDILSHFITLQSSLPNVD